METKRQNLAWGGQSYESPSSTLIELRTEGVLCASATPYESELQDLTETDFAW